MKTTFKKSVLAFLTCVLALAFALTGCSGGGKDPKANFVGSWELSGGTLEGEELTDEYMKMLEDEIGRDAVLEYVKEVTTEILEYTENPDVLSSAREAIAYRLMDELEK